MFRILARSFNLRRLHNLTPNKHSNFLRKKKLVSGISAAIAGSLAFDGYTNDFQRFLSGQRFLKSMKIAMLISLDYSWSLAGVREDSPNYEDILHKVHLRSAERLLQGCLENGGLYVKIGQGVSSINHILPIEYTDTLKKLEDRCLPRQINEVTKVFLEDFGRTPDELFESFNYIPIAAASLAQVFKAKTKNGESVAVKVQYRDLQKRFKTDIGTILFIQNLVAMVHKNYDFGWIIEDLKDSLEMELDFRNEVRNAEQCAKDLAELDFVYIPKIHHELSGLRIMTAEFIDGFKVSDRDRIAREKFNIAEIDTKMFKLFAEQIFRTGFVHADPHPGNIFVRRNKKGKTELVLLDHGLYENLSPDIRNNLCNFWEAIVRRDFEAMKQYAAALDVGDHMRFAEILLQRPMSTRMIPLTTRYTDADLEHMKLIASKRFDIIMDVLKEMPRNLLFVVRNLNTVRSIAREHGDPVDRPKVMARSAIACLLHEKNGIYGYFKYLTRKIHFEYKLWKMTFQFWFTTTYIRLLTTLGRAPPETEALLDVKFDV